MPLPVLPVKKVLEEHAIYTETRDPDRIIYTKPLNAVSHGEEDLPLIIITYNISGKPHIQRMNK